MLAATFLKNVNGKKYENWTYLKPCFLNAYLGLQDPVSQKKPVNIPRLQEYN
jgi:hypothetical protein